MRSLCILYFSAFESLVDNTVTNENLHASFLFCQSNDGCQLSKEARACPGHHRS
jgi:hypothetical protein